MVPGNHSRVITMVPMAYEVTTPVFEGPFDLLLHLILREQVELYDISLTRLVDGYLAEFNPSAAIYRIWYPKYRNVRVWRAIGNGRRGGHSTPSIGDEADGNDTDADDRQRQCDPAQPVHDRAHDRAERDTAIGGGTPSPRPRSPCQD